MTQMGGNITSYGQTTVIPYIPYLPPVITSMTTSEPQGGIITITGQNFGMNLGVVTVTVRGVPCTNLKYATIDTAITCQAVSYNGANTPVIVTVEGQSSGPTSLSYYQPSIQTMTSPPTQGGMVTISGSHFGNGTQISVTLGGKACVVATATSSQVTCNVAGGIGANLTASITTFSLTGTGTFSYQPPVVYNVTSVSTLGGTAIITGINFGTLASAISVYLTSSITCNNIKVIQPHTQISCDINPGTGQKIDLSVTVSNQVSSGYFSYLVPSINSIDSPVTSGQTVTVTGQNFGNDNRMISVSFGGYPCTLPSVIESSVSFLCFAPAGTGNVSVYVTVNNATSSAFVVTYQPPTITGISAAEQSGGVLKIYGTNFGRDASVINISLPCVNITVLTPHTTLGCALDYDIIAEVAFVVDVNGQTANYTGIIRSPSALYLAQYYGLMALLKNRPVGGAALTINYCDYPGVNCSLGNIISIDFSGISLQSDLKGLCNMTSLASVDMAGCDMTGVIPTCMDTFIDLTFMDLSNNSLSGSIPSIFGLVYIGM